ncbi:DUF2834 domain-containing protein [Allofranklinella schreckenbergeri]|uniref:DUF2834 domain-containing protein n=1 Tax=Allofranklinella schreckenbergeri TaxID=1076744 RepID=A0A3M6QA86_9BURK|nr:DUF2834 domain-containing protein [Allofranklinella schreckenbergeri]RMX00076.1 DUF2834 domain-containing protein [Allofranklinella schreckenbergeri]
MQRLYLALCLIGTALPLAQFIPWLAEHGLHLSLMWQQIQADRLSAFVWADVVVSALALIAFVLVESRRIGLRHGPLALLGLAVGVSLALPLFLWLRQRRLDHASSQGANP